MRFVIELPPTLARQLAERIEGGVYASIDAAAAEAFARLLDGTGASTPSASGAHSGEGLLRPPTRRVVEGAPVVDQTVPPEWIWGMINRVFPLKVATRVCAALCIDGPVSLSVLRARAAEAATMVGRRLEADDAGVGRRRNEGRSVGFPLRNPLSRAKLRFAMQFVGRRANGGHFTGGVFETGLIGPVDAKTDRVAPTATGWTFAGLRSPALDDESADRNLSEEESSFYVNQIASSVPAERSAFSVILRTLAEGPLSPDDLSRRAKPTTGPGMAETVAITARAGVIGRLIDVGAVRREPSGRSAILRITDFGRVALDAVDKSK